MIDFIFSKCFFSWWSRACVFDVSRGQTLNWTVVCYRALYIHIHIQAQTVANPPTGMFLWRNWKKLDETWTLGEHEKFHTHSNLRLGWKWEPWGGHRVTQEQSSSESDVCVCYFRYLEEHGFVGLKAFFLGGGIYYWNVCNLPKI